MIILSHSGKQHSYQVAKALYNLNYLEKFYTSSYLRSEKIQRFLQNQGDSFWSRRFISGLPGKFVDSNWRFELPEIVLRKFQGKSFAVQKAVYRRDVKFDAYIAKLLSNNYSGGKPEKQVFWGFQGSCHESLVSANALGFETVCELATAHVVAAKKILGEEALLHPEWAASIDNLVFPADYEKRLENEPIEAKHVIAASAFTKQSLIDSGIEENKITILPLGFDPSAISFTENPNDKLNSRPLKLLYAGTVTQRKGIKYLLEALKNLNLKNDIELHIIGGIQASADPLKKYENLFFYHEAVSQSELFSKFGEYDALVLPTVFEGFGLVIVEAMAAGLPVITTPNSMGPEVIIDDKNGYIVPIRNVEALSNAIKKLREKSNSDFLQMRRDARSSALDFSWENYTQRLKIVIETKL